MCETTSESAHRPMYMAPSHSIPRIDQGDLSSLEADSLIDAEEPTPEFKKLKTTRISMLSWCWFRSFVKVATFQQHTTIRVFTYALLYTALACLVAFYLMETAAYREESPTALKYIVMSAVVLSGLHMTAILLLGFAYLYPKCL